MEYDLLPSGPLLTALILSQRRAGVGWCGVVGESHRPQSENTWATPSPTSHQLCDLMQILNLSVLVCKMWLVIGPTSCGCHEAYERIPRKLLEHCVTCES